MSGVRIVVTGGTGVLGRSAVSALTEAGHEVAVVVRSARSTAVVADLHVRALHGDVLRGDGLDAAFEGADAVVNLACAMPVGHSLLAPRAWRRHDALRTTGVRHVVEAARRAGVRRVVQESVSLLYADQGEEWVTESSPLEITGSTEPAAVGESLVQDFTCGSRTGVVLRLGTLVGDDPQTRHQLRAVAQGRRIHGGHPADWAHVLHTDDVGEAVVAALHAPSGVYNVGAEPVQRHDLAQGYADAVRADSALLRPSASRWRGGSRYEPMTRSLRVCSEFFASQTGWRPLRPKFDVSWFDGVLDPLVATR